MFADNALPWSELVSKKLFSATTHCENGLCSQKAIFAKDEFKTRSLKVQLGVLRGEIRARGGVVPQSLRSKEKERAAAKEAKERRREEARRERRRCASTHIPYSQLLLVPITFFVLAPSATTDLSRRQKLLLLNAVRPAGHKG